MPRDFPNPPAEITDRKRLLAGHGREVIAFVNESDAEQVIAFYKDGDYFIKNPGALKKLYQTLLTHEILNLLFPENFPKWFDAGINKDGYVATVRKKVVGMLKEKGSSVQLLAIKNLFIKNGLPLSLDLAKPNIFFHENIEKYVDSSGVFVRGNTDIDRLIKITEQLNIDEKTMHRVIKLSKRIIALEKINI